MQMNFVSIRVVIDDIKRLVAFYEQVTDTTATWSTPDFAEIGTGLGTVAIGSTRTLAAFSGSDLRPADNRSLIIEFLVDDVDQQFARLNSVITPIQPPTTMPWGNRSLLFRDPDGALVNLFTPVSDAAIARFASRRRP